MILLSARRAERRAGLIYKVYVNIEIGGCDNRGGSWLWGM